MEHGEGSAHDGTEAQSRSRIQGKDRKGTELSLPHYHPQAQEPSKIGEGDPGFPPEHKKRAQDIFI